MASKKQKAKRKIERLERKRQLEYERKDKMREYGTSLIAESILVKREGEVGGKEELFLNDLCLNRPVDLSTKQEFWLSKLMLKYGFSIARRSNGKLSLIDRGISKQKRNDIQLLYLIECEPANAMKIGIALEPQNRIGDLQVGNPYPLKLIKTYCLELQAKKVEAKLHEYFSSSRMQGEWFRGLRVLDVDDAISKLNLH